MGDFLLNFLKFILAILLAPLVIASAVAFQKHLGSYPVNYQEFFLWGVWAFLFIFLFLDQFWGVYETGQKIMQGIFKFLAPLEVLVSYLIPFYLFIIFVLFFFTAKFLGVNKFDHYFIFFIGFLLTMHVILTAQDLQEQEKTPIKANYLFTMCGVFVTNMVTVVLLVDWILGKFSAPIYIKSTLITARYFYMFSFDKILFF